MGSLMSSFTAHVKPRPAFVASHEVDTVAPCGLKGILIQGSTFCMGARASYIHFHSWLKVLFVLLVLIKIAIHCS